MEKKMEEFLREKKAGMNQQGTSTSTNQPNQDDPDAGEGASRQHQRGPFTTTEAQRSEGVLDLRKKLDEEKEYHGPVKRQKDDKDKDKEPPSSSKKSKRKE
ncbi:uncharacterized protein LOC108738213 isoform X2 [Agrilus planipennis]|uniref:Uncharacterized protein LOC108738213 isoform X2 n=1 Tax=Agrilus planipennis TaxID=224129 RepID=A0A1W4WSY6_AGRPL|nr:uncharacterized protein LOC108738213 isoform X2 [Agrilus planipennis]